MPHGLAELRHGIRGALNALKLCVSAFEMPLDTSEKLEFLMDIETSADKVSTLIAELELLPEFAETPAEAAAHAIRVQVR